MGSPNTILILTHSSMYFDDRIKRQANTLAETYRVILFAKAGIHNAFPPGLSDRVELVEYKNVLSRGAMASVILNLFIQEKRSIVQTLVRLFLKYYFRMTEEKLYFDYMPMYQEAYRDLLKYIEDNGIRHDIRAIISNDVFVLPIADRIRRGLRANVEMPARVVGDMHEIHFDYNPANPFNQALRTWLCRGYLPRLDAVISVSEQAATLYRDKYKLKEAFSVLNAPPYEKIDIGIVRASDHIRLVHIGAAAPDRKLEHMIEAMVYLDPAFELYFHLVFHGSEAANKYVLQLKRLVEEHDLQGRVFIEDAIPPDRLIKYISRYDIGVYYMGKLTPNHEYAMPNKLFQYVMARLGIVVSNKGEMAKIVELYDVGIVPKTTGLKAYAEAIKEVAGKLSYYKQQSDQAAASLCSEKEWEKLNSYLGVE